MLDQNTDRMWYVIGAVIVGAALIFLMNGTFPTLFANVGTTFEDKTEDVSAVVDIIGSVKKGPGEEVDGATPVPVSKPLVITPNMVSVHPVYAATSKFDASSFDVDGSYLVSVGDEVWDGVRITARELGLKPNTTYEMVYDVLSVSGTLETFGGHLDVSFLDHTVTVDGEPMPSGHYSREMGAVHMNDERLHRVVVTFTTPDEVKPDHLFYIQPDRGVKTPAVVKISNWTMSEVK